MHCVLFAQISAQYARKACFVSAGHIDTRQHACGQKQRKISVTLEGKLIYFYCFARKYSCFPY